MSTSKRLATTEHGPVLTITIEGHHDIYRITHALARAQCDFADLSRRIRRSHEKQLGPERMAQLDGYFNGKQMAGVAKAALQKRADSRALLESRDRQIEEPEKELPGLPTPTERRERPGPGTVKLVP